MSPSLPPGEVTRLLGALDGGGHGGDGARETLYQRVYDELYALARYHRARWSGNETLNTTALVHEAYLRLVGDEGAFADRQHFMAVASRAMRCVLHSYAERQAAQKRGGGVPDLPFDERTVIPPGRAEAYVALEEALGRLEAVDERAARVVECRFFGGLSVDETATALAVSPRTVARDWIMARTWLYGELRGEEGAETPVIALGAAA